MKNLDILFCAIFVVVIATSTATAEKLLLRNGGSIEGTITKRPDESGNNFYLVKLEGNVTIKLTKGQVRAVEKTNDEYELLRIKAGDTLEGHRRMEVYCREKSSLKKQREFHLRSIVKLAPNDEAARRSLGYILTDGGKWISRDQLYKNRGYIKQGTNWKLPEMAAIEKAQEEQAQAIRDWNIKCKRWRGWLSKKNEDKIAEAMKNFKAIKDPAAANAIVDLMKKEKEVELRRLYIDILGRLNSGVAANFLVKIAVLEKDDVGREEAIRILKERETKGIIFQLHAFLNPGRPGNVPIIINRAAVVLGRIGNPESIPRLIDSLVTEHVVVPGKGNSGGQKVGVGFNSDGGGGFNFGEKKEATKKLFPNENVLEALRLLTKRDFRFNQEKWKEWLASENAPKNYDFRRTNDLHQ